MAERIIQDSSNSEKSQSVSWTPIVWAVAIILVLFFVVFWLWPRMSFRAPVISNPIPSKIDVNVTVPTGMPK